LHVIGEPAQQPVGEVDERGSPREGSRESMIGILAYGSLISDPGWEIENLIDRIIANIETPFAVEYARKSKTRAYAPTLVPVENEKGVCVNASIFVLTPKTEITTATNILYRRERHIVGDTKKIYMPSGVSDTDKVTIEQIQDFCGVHTVLFTRIGVNIPEIIDNSISNEGKAELLAGLAINSVTSQTFAKNEDGLYYLASAIQNGIKTKLTDQYSQAILRLTDNSQDLSGARLAVARRNNLS
jgi:hypothetical protein